ncbi:hypothetical protein QUF73_13710 [Cytobacillus sp. NJ13]|nr:hypothetical protein [Cytobacillus sp. NJ13]
MGLNLVFHIPTYTKENSALPKPMNDNYSYWAPLINYFLPKSNTIEIHCWNEEIESIKELKSLYKQEFAIVKEENLTIFKGSIDSAISNYILYNSLNKSGEFKWFTINLDKGEKTIFYSGHWATEFLINNIMEKDIEVIKQVTPPDTDFHHLIS